MTRHEDDARTKNCAEKCHQKYPTWQSAIIAYTKSYNSNQVIAYPPPNTCWWTEPIRVRNATELAADTSTSSEEAMWATLALAEEDAAARAMLDSLRNLTVNW